METSLSWPSCSFRHTASSSLGADLRGFCGPFSFGPAVIDRIAHDCRRARCRLLGGDGAPLRRGVPDHVVGFRAAAGCRGWRARARGSQPWRGEYDQQCGCDCVLHHRRSPVDCRWGNVSLESGFRITRKRRNRREAQRLGWVPGPFVWSPTSRATEEWLSPARWSTGLFLWARHIGARDQARAARIS